MPSPGRVILVAGQGGAGATSMARSTVEAIRTEGLDALLVEASDDHGTMPDTAVIDALAATLGRLWQEAGADPLVPEAWSGLADVALLDAWVRIAQARRECDAVVVDAGSLGRLRDLCTLPGSLALLVDAAMTPRMAMWRSALGEGGLFESLSDLRMAVRSWLGILHHDETTARLVARPERAAVDSVLRAGAQLSMLGVGVDGVVVNRVPRKGGGGRRRAARTEALATTAALAEGFDGVPVWRSPLRSGAMPAVRPAPTGISPLALLAGGAVPPTRSETMAVTSTDDGYLLSVPLRGAARAGARIGVQADRLVLSLDGVHAWHELPSVLRRCAPIRAVRTSRGVTVHWSPDPQVWPTRASAAPGSGEDA